MSAGPPPSPDQAACRRVLHRLPARASPTRRPSTARAIHSQRDGLRLYHDGLLEQLARRFDVDRSDAQKRMSLGMQVASLVGALAFSAAVFMFFYRFWGDLGTGSQVAILAAAPPLSVLGVHIAAKREKTLYFASILGLVAFACFVLDISMVATIFNMQDSPNGLLLWAAFAFSSFSPPAPPIFIFFFSSVNFGFGWSSTSRAYRSCIRSISRSLTVSFTGINDNPRVTPPTVTAHPISK